MSNSEDNWRTQFEGYVVEHHVRLRAFVRSLGVDSDWVDDVAQEAFLTAYCEYDSYDESRDFGKWLRGIAANIVRNEIRKDARRNRLLHTRVAEILLRRYAETSERKEPLTIAAVHDCLDQLAPRSREVIQGRYHNGETAPELASRLGISAASVRQMLVRIRRKVKRCVEHRVSEGATL